MRMVQAGYRLRLALEAGADVGLIRKVIEKNSNRNGSIEPGIPRLINCAQASRANGTLNFVMAQTCA